MRSTSIIILFSVFSLLLTACAENEEGIIKESVAEQQDIAGQDVPAAPGAAAQQAYPSPQQISAAELEGKNACGDSLCEGTENECSCPTDCGTCEERAAGMCERYECTPLNACVKLQEAACCGDGVCGSGESCSSCMSDCCTTTKTLADFPKLAERFTVVVGRNAPAQDIVTAANLASVLKQLNVGVGETKLDDEVLDLRTRDYLVVGSPCDNAIAAQLLGAKHKNQCAVIPRGEGRIQLIATSETTIALLVTGSSPGDVEWAAKRLVQYQEKPLSGMKVTI